MKKKLTTFVCGFLVGTVCVSSAVGQTEEKGRDEYKGLTLKLGDNEFIRFITWHQIWLRFQELNPGSSIGGSGADNNYDIGLRRSRFLGFAELNDFQIMTHFGINNQHFGRTDAASPNPRKPQLFFHDVWAQYSLVKNHLDVGFGLHYWNGISRLTNASTLNFMTLDAPITNWPTIDRTDQFARFMGMWAKGNIGLLEYRVAVNKPFYTDRPLSFRSDYRGNSYFSYAGYFEFQLLDLESDTLPYKVGTYIGKKKVFNLGAGFYIHPQSMQSQAASGEIEVHDQILVGVDAFVDMPLGDRETSGAISGYLVFYNYDFGPDHIRDIGIMNVVDRAQDGQTTYQTFGNAYPSIGTGQHIYFQGGYLIPPALVGGWEFMPYVAVQYSNLEALEDPMVLFEGGLNWFLQGHHAKITMAFRSRPVFEERGELDRNVEVVSDGRASEFIVQTMIFL